MSIKSYLGLDGFDLLLQAAVTGVLLGWIVAANNPQDAQIGVGVVTTASLVVLGIRRHLGLRRMARIGLTTGEVVTDRLAELEQRMADLEAAQTRILELEERVDFAERLLAQAPAGPRGVSAGGER